MYFNTQFIRIQKYLKHLIRGNLVMSLIKCKNCGIDIEDNISVCPECGTDLKSENKKEN